MICVRALGRLLGLAGRPFISYSTIEGLRNAMSNHHRGTFIGRTTPEHGMSRQHHSVIIADAGGVVYTAEKIALPSGMRVIYELVSGDSGETLAVNVNPLDLAAVEADTPRDHAPAKRAAKVLLADRK
jgi:hypothetical protein